MRNILRDRRNWPTALLLLTIISIWSITFAQQGNQVIPGALSVITNGASSNPLGSAINVKASPYNAFGDSIKLIDVAVGGTQSTLTSASYSFQQSDVKKLVYCVWTGGGVGTLIVPFASTNSGSVTPVAITSVSAGVATYNANPPGGGGTTNNVCIFGHDDTAAFLAAATAANANAATAFPPTNLVGPAIHYQSNLYAPAGGYMLASKVFNFTSASGTTQIPGVIGDGEDKTVFYTRPDWPTAGYNPNDGVFATFSGVGPRIEDWSVDGAGFLYGFTNVNFIHFKVSGADLRNIRVGNYCNNAQSFAMYFDGSGAVYNPYTADSGCPTTNVAGGQLYQGGGPQGDVYSIFTSNTGQNLAVTGVVGGSSGNHLTFHGGFVDEQTATTCTTTFGGPASAPTCIATSLDVDFVGTILTSNGTNGALAIDGTSEVRCTHCNLQSFGVNNSSGVVVANGGILHMTMSEAVARSASGFCYNFNTTGVFDDVGGNKCTLISGGSLYKAGSVFGTFNLTAGSVTQLGRAQVVNGAVPTGCAVTGNGTSTCTLSTGSTDAAGSITISAAGTTTSTGLVSITYSNTIGTNQTVCNANYASGTGTWATGAIPPIFITDTTTAMSFNINNAGVNLTAASTYKVNYECYGM